MRNAWIAAVAGLLALGLSGCDEDKKRPIGGVCGGDAECASGLCYQGLCLDPAGDEDGDGLVNAIEAALETDPYDADTDGDGVRDLDELDADLEHKDTDGDGRPDAIESATEDADGDCVPDELDPADDDPVQGQGHPAVAEACPTAGVCGASGATLAVACPDGLEAPVCDFAAVPGYAAVDDDCDGEDDSCSGDADDDGDCVPLPQWCRGVSPQVDGRYVVRPFEDTPSFEVTCLFSAERGDWALYDAAGAAGYPLAYGEGTARQYLLYAEGAWYRSPITHEAWDWDAYTSVAGLWVYADASGQVGAFDCDGDGEPGELGLGCANGEGLPGVVARGAADADAGELTLCQGDPGAFGSGCVAGVQVYVRPVFCVPDEGQLLQDGGFAELARDDSCWFAQGDGEALRYFSFETEDLAPGAEAPAVRADNPTLGNDIWALQLLQSEQTFIAGRSYLFGFWARAGAPRSIRVFFQSRDLQTGIHFEDPALQAAWTYHLIAFTAAESSWDAFVEFQLAETSTEPVWIDDVSLVDVGPAACAPQGGGAVVGDGDFSYGPLCWEPFDHAGVTTAVPDFGDVPPEGSAPSLRLIPALGTDDASDAGVRQNGLTIAQGRLHRVSYWVKAETGGVVTVVVDGPVGTIFSNTGDVGTEWIAYSFEFVAEGGASGDGALRFHVGNPSAGAVWLDGVHLEDLGPAPIPR